MPLSVATTEICPTIDRAIVLLRQMGTRGYPQGLRAWKLKSRLTQGVPSRRIECPAVWFSGHSFIARMGYTFW